MFGKKQNKEEIVEPETLIEEAPIVSAPTKSKAKREHFFGTLLLGGLIIVVCFGLFGVGFGAFTLWQAQSVKNQAPSISNLSTSPMVEGELLSVEEQPAPAPEETKKEATDDATAESLKKAQALDLIVMNGGGAKGVATEVSELLKKEGFTKVTVGNTTGDFTGTVLYTKKEMTAEAEAVKAKLATKYPSLMVKEALASDKETQTATLTLIFGKE
jgi:LytR cell envelope-related transcriptional attenuator